MTCLNTKIDDSYICNNFIVIDVETEEQLDRCIWANDETGEYEIYKYVPGNNYIHKEIKKGYMPHLMNDNVRRKVWKI